MPATDAQAAVNALKERMTARLADLEREPATDAVLTNEKGEAVLTVAQYRTLLNRALDVKDADLITQWDAAQLRKDEELKPAGERVDKRKAEQPRTFEIVRNLDGDLEFLVFTNQALADGTKSTFSFFRRGNSKSLKQIWRMDDDIPTPKAKLHVELGKGSFLWNAIAGPGGGRMGLSLINQVRKEVNKFRREITIAREIGSCKYIDRPYFGGVYTHQKRLKDTAELGPETTAVNAYSDLASGSLDELADPEKFAALLARLNPDQRAQLRKQMQTSDFIIHILTALAAVDKAEVVHNDVKPHNILLFIPLHGECYLKLGDLGSAFKISELKETGAVKYFCDEGTRLYNAPEKKAGEQIGAPADLWALGITCLELIIRPSMSRDEFNAVLMGGLRKPEVKDFIASTPILALLLQPDPSDRTNAEDILSRIKSGELEFNLEALRVQWNAQRGGLDVNTVTNTTAISAMKLILLRIANLESELDHELHQQKFGRRVSVSSSGMFDGHLALGAKGPVPPSAKPPVRSPADINKNLLEQITLLQRLIQHISADEQLDLFTKVRRVLRKYSETAREPAREPGSDSDPTRLKGS